VVTLVLYLWEAVVVVKKEQVVLVEKYARVVVVATKIANANVKFVKIPVEENAFVLVRKNDAVEITVQEDVVLGKENSN
jgi:regulator of protease activity HflC (stomatin/prohibitin superfamily)